MSDTKLEAGKGAPSQPSDVTRREFVEMSVAAAMLTGLVSSVGAAESKGDIPRRTLGRTGEKVSMVAIGGFHVGKPELSVDKKPDHVDLMQFHEIIRMADPDRIFAAGGAMEAVLDAKKALRSRGSMSSTKRLITSMAPIRILAGLGSTRPLSGGAAHTVRWRR